MAETALASDTDTDYDFDTVSDCDADEDVADLHAIVTNILSHVSDDKPLGSEYQALINAYHSRYTACPCTGLLPSEAETYHLKLIIAVLEFYYGPDYTFTFVADLPLLGEEPSSAQTTAMFPDERVPYQVQFRLVQEGIMEQLPPPGTY